MWSAVPDRVLKRTTMIKMNGVRMAAATEAMAVHVRLSVAATRAALAASTAAGAAIGVSSFQGA